MPDSWGPIIGWSSALLLIGCTGAAPPTAPAATTVPPVPEAPASAPPVAAWPAGGDCRALAAAIAARPPAARAALDRTRAPLALAVSGAPGRPAPAEAATLDVPLPLDDGRRDCVLLLAAAPTMRAAPRRKLAHETVQSSYRASGGARPNPDHRRLQRELRAAQGGDGVGLVATGDPALDLIGLVAGTVLEGIGTALSGRSEAALRAELAATPRTLREAAWEAYAFEVVTLAASRRGRIRAWLLDRARGLAWGLDQPVLEERRFRVAQGRRARDRGLLEGGDGLAAPAEVAVWEQSGLRPSLAALLARFGPAADPSVRAVALADVAEAAGPAPAAGPEAPASASALAGAVAVSVGADGLPRFRLRAPEPATDPPP